MSSDEHVSNEHKARIIYIPHGGGPLPVLGDPGHSAMVDFMQSLSKRYPRPEAILIISAHWEAAQVSVTGSADPGLLYDYYGFPPEAYEITYPAPGAPELAHRVVDLVMGSGEDCAIDSERGFDHGVFVPLKLMYPAADIPVLQMSLIRGLDPVRHLELGKALQPLLEERILVIGSGFSFHNLRAFQPFSDDRPDAPNDRFQEWLIDTCTETEGSRIYERLIHWADAPEARYCHPREEHLLPLHVCAGIASQIGGATTVFDGYVAGKRSVAFEW